MKWLNKDWLLLRSEKEHERTWKNFGFQYVPTSFHVPCRKRHAQLRRLCLQILGVKAREWLCMTVLFHVVWTCIEFRVRLKQPETICNLAAIASWRIIPCPSWCEKLLARLLRTGRVRGGVLCWRMLGSLAKRDHASTLRHPWEESRQMAV